MCTDINGGPLSNTVGTASGNTFAERIHHDNPIAQLTDAQLAELARVTGGEGE
jgi:hypothetical protein